MRTILTALVAASLAYVINSVVIKKLGITVLVSIVPLVEEFLKTYFAVAFKVHILAIHALFGFIEAYSDYQAGEHYASLLSIVSHMIFGSVAWFSYIKLGLWWSILCSFVIHLLFNRWALSDKDKTP